MNIPIIWLGDAQSYQQVLKAYEWGANNPDYRPPGFKMQEGDSGDDEDETLVEFLAKEQIDVYGNVGVLAIDGPLVNEDSFWNAIFGLVSYNTVSTALNMLLEDEEVTEIVLNLGTPGGDSQGLEGLSTNIEEAGRIKPITAWSGTNALSAGYWIASSAGKVTGAKMAEFGSIGVVTTATNYAKMLEKEGIQVEVIRAGKYKAPVHPAEELSDKGRKILEEKTERLYSFFLEHVARARTLDISNKDSWAEGKVFFADEAIPVGLVDEVTSLNELVSRLTVISEPTGDDPMGKQVILSDESRAKLASGAALEDLEHKVVDTEDSTDISAQDSAGDTDAQDTQAVDDVTEAPKGGELQVYLQEQLTTAQGDLVTAKAENAKLTTRADELAEQNAALLGIAIEATHRLQVALGQAPTNLADMPSATVISYYGSCKDQFDKTFKAGRTSLDADDAPKTTGDEAARALGITPIEG